MKSSAHKDSGFTDVYGNVGIANTFCYEISGGTRCDCPGFREGAGEQPPGICQCGHLFCVHDIVRASAEITCRLHGSIRSLVCIRGRNQKIIDFGPDGSWAARVKLVPSVRLHYGLWPNDLTSQIAYFRLASRGLIRTVRLPGVDSGSIVRAVTDAFGDTDILRGRRWMPLNWHDCSRRLEPDQIDPSTYSLEFLIERCITDWPSSTSSTVSFDITLEDESLSWEQIWRLPEVLVGLKYEFNWAPDCPLARTPSIEFAGAWGGIHQIPDSESSGFDANPIDRYLRPPSPSRRPVLSLNDSLVEGQAVPFAGAWEEIHQSSESSLRDGEPDTTASTTTDYSYFCDGGGEVVERSVRLNKASLVNQVLVYIRCLVQGIIATSGWIVEHTGNYEQPRGTIGRTTSGGSSNSQSRKRNLDADEHQSENTPSDEEDGERNNGRGEMSSTKGVLEPKCNFACPFFKYNARKYMFWRSCPGPGWNTVHRIKEHLYRRHALPKFVCDRCFEPFQDADSLRLHHRAKMPCSVREEPQDAFEGVTPAQELQLRSRKRSRIGVRDTEHEKWIHIYQVLFPEETRIPSPYYDYEETKTQKCKQSDLISDSENYEKFLRQELPPLLQEELRQLVEQEIEEELRTIPSRAKERLKVKVTNAVQKFQLTLFTRYQESQAGTGDGCDHPISLAESREGVGAGDMFDPQQLLGDLGWDGFDWDGILEESIQSPPTLAAS